MSQNNNNGLSAEMGVICSILIQQECFDETIGVLTVDDFDNSFCHECFRVISEMYDKDGFVDTMLVAEKVSVKYGYAREELAKMIDLLPTTANIRAYVKVVKENSNRRKIQRIGSQLLYENNNAETVQELSQFIKDSLDNINDNSTASEALDGSEWLKSFMQEELHIVENPNDAFVKTKYTDLDNILGGGMVKGGLYVIGARPGVGKTTMALNIAEQVCSRNISALFISLEMSSRQIMCKRISSECGIPYVKLMSGNLTIQEQQQMRDCALEISKRPFYINKKVGLTTLDILSLAKKYKTLDLLVIDYIGLIKPAHPTESRYNDYTAISGELKQMAMMLDIPILALSQLNRENTKRNDKRPTLADLRDTGAIEQDADAVIFLHRDNYCNNNAESDHTIELIVAKNRHGNTGTVTMDWDGDTGGITSVDRMHETTEQPKQPTTQKATDEITEEDLPF